MAGEGCSHSKGSWGRHQGRQYLGRERGEMATIALRPARGRESRQPVIRTGFLNPSWSCWVWGEQVGVTCPCRDPFPWCPW